MRCIWKKRNLLEFNESSFVSFSSFSFFSFEKFFFFFFPPHRHAFFGWTAVSPRLPPRGLSYFFFFVEWRCTLFELKCNPSPSPLPLVSQRGVLRESLWRRIAHESKTRIGLQSYDCDCNFYFETHINLKVPIANVFRLHRWDCQRENTKKKRCQVRMQHVQELDYKSLPIYTYTHIYICITKYCKKLHP